MNVILADQYVRNHTDDLMAEAARARLVRQVRGGRRWHGRHARSGAAELGR